MNDEATQLLLQVMRQTDAAKALLDSLVEALRAHEVLRAPEVAPCLNELERHLRQANAACVSLCHLARGGKPPRVGG